MGSLVITDEQKDRVKNLVPSWFKLNAGFQFLYDNSPAMVIGWGGWRDTKYHATLSLFDSVESLYKIDFCPPTLVTAYLYKGEWHMSDWDKMTAEGMDAIKESI